LLGHQILCNQVVACIPSNYHWKDVLRKAAWPHVDFAAQFAMLVQADSSGHNAFFLST
jgi:hypothetical protein